MNGHYQNQSSDAATVLGRVLGAYPVPDSTDSTAEIPNELACTEQILHKSPENSLKKSGYIWGYSAHSRGFSAFDINSIVNVFDDRRGHHPDIALPDPRRSPSHSRP